MIAAAPIVLADLSYNDGFDRIKITQLLTAQGAVAATTAPPTPTPADVPPAVPPPAVPTVPAAPEPVVAVPTPEAVAGVGDTVQWKEPEGNGTFVSGIVDSIAPDGTMSVGIDAETAYTATADEVTVTAKAATPAPLQPPVAPVALAPAAVPAPVPAAPAAPIPAAPIPTAAPADPQLEALILLAAAYKIEVNDINTKEEVVAALNECEWRADLVDVADVTLLTSVGITVGTAPAADPPAAPAPAPSPAKPAAKKKAKKKAKKRKKRA